MGMGTKEVRKQAEHGGEKPKNKEKKPKWWGRKKKKIRGVFNRWQLNSFALVEFVWLHWRAIEMDSTATIGW
jgi:hypothetical protein